MFDFKGLPEQPPRPVDLLPGLKYTSAFDKSLIFSLILMVMLVSVFPVVMILTMEKGVRLPFTAMEKTDGIVTEIIDHSNCDRETVAYHYQFVARNDRNYYGKHIACRDSMYSTLRVGDSLPIEYDPGDPTYNGIEGELGKNEPPFLIFLFLPLIFVFIFISMLMPNLKQIRKARTIFRNGLIAKGEIVFAGRKKPMGSLTFKGLTSMEVFYTFIARDGREYDAKVSTDNDWLVHKLTLGSPVTVSYMENKPGKSMILDFYYR